MNEGKKRHFQIKTETLLLIDLPYKKYRESPLGGKEMTLDVTLNPWKKQRNRKGKYVGLCNR